MSLKQQIRLAFTAPLQGLRSLSTRGRLLLTLYLMLAAMLLGLVLLLAEGQGDRLTTLLNHYLFPASWHPFSTTLVQVIIDRIPAGLVANVLVLSTLMMISLVLFPLKEKVSVNTEVRGGLTDGLPAEHPLWFQALEEIKMVGLNLAVILSLIWVGYQPGKLAAFLSVTLSAFQVACFFAIDFISPLLQRHGWRYADILPALARRPALSLTFGLMLGLPAVAAGLVAGSATGMSTPALLAMLFVAELIPIAVAIVAGTVVAAHLLPAMDRSRRAGRGVVVATYAVVILALVANTLVISAVGRSLHHKSQLLKCTYDVPLDSFELIKPTVEELKSLKATIGLKFAVEVSNPSAIDVNIEKNRLVLTNGDERLLETSLPLLTVPANQSIRHPIEYKKTLTAESALEAGATMVRGAKKLWAGLKKAASDPLGALNRGVAFVKGAKSRADELRKNLRVVLYFEVLPGFEFPFYLVHPE
jgi:hypothetical protein